jgi:hypothetical protein
VVRIGPYKFTTLRYDAFNDELDCYLEGRSGGIGRSAKELHVWYYEDEHSDEPIGITLNGPRLMLKRLGAVHVTLPAGKPVNAEGVEESLEANRSPHWPELE